MPIEAESIRVLEESGGRDGDTGSSYAYPLRTLESRGILEQGNQSGNLAEDMVVALRRLGWQTESVDGLFGMSLIEDRSLDLRAAEVNAPVVFLFLSRIGVELSNHSYSFYHRFMRDTTSKSYSPITDEALTEKKRRARHWDNTALLETCSWELFQ